MAVLRKIRIGTDITLGITVMASGHAVDWNSQDIKHVYAFSDIQGQPVAEMSYEQRGSTLRCVFHAEDQNYVGAYRVIIEFNDGSAFSSTLDMPAFEIVRTSEEADIDTGEVVLDIDGSMRFYSLAEVISKLEGLHAEVKAAASAAREASDNANAAAKKANDAAALANSNASKAEASNKVINDNERKRISQETARESAEAERKRAELERQKGDESIANKEAERERNEETRETNEQTREDNELERRNAESARNRAEAQRASRETTRISNETSRQAAENKRVAAETLRQEAETSRVNVESERVTEFARLKKESEEATKTASAVSDVVAQHTTKITKIEQLLQEGYTFMGVATLEMDPGTPAQKVFYIANEKGTYPNFNNISVYDGEIALLKYDTTWEKQSFSNDYVVRLSYIGNQGSEINKLPAGSFAFNTYNNTICRTTEVDGEWIARYPLTNAIYLYDDVIYLYDGKTLVMVKDNIYPNLNHCGFYFDISGQRKYYAANRITELLNIPRQNCVIHGLWEVYPQDNYQVCFFDEDLNFVGGYTEESTTQIFWDVEKINVPTNAKYMILQTQDVHVYIQTNENLCTGIDYVSVKDGIFIDSEQKYAINTLDAFLKNEEIVYDTKGYLENTGDISLIDNSKCTSKYYPLSNYFTYLVTGQSASACYLFAYYDRKKNKISTYKTDKYIVDVDIETLLPKPDNAYYVRFSCFPIDDGYGAKIQPKHLYSSQKWLGKKWAVVGDSLTVHNFRALLNYHDYVAEKTGLSVVNLGVSGTGYGRGQDSNNAFYQRTDNIPLNTDVITIFGSFNDLGANLPLGNIGDSDTTSLCGCINKTIDNLQNRTPLVNLGVITPTPWATTQPTINGESVGENYVNAIINICKYRSIPCLDLFHCSNLRPWDASFRSKAYKRDGTYTESTAETPNAIQVTAELLDYIKSNGVPNAAVGDWVLMSGGGTHPDEDGHKIIASRFEDFLDALLLA